VHNPGGVGTILKGNRGGLVDVNVASLGFGNVNARHQARSVGNTGENCAGANLLAGANRDFLEDSFHAGANKERLSLLAAQIVERLHLRDFGLFRDHWASRASSAMPSFSRSIFRRVASESARAREILALIAVPSCAA
jgi:hypothetical protein